VITLTLKNIPKELHEKLKASAERNRRSLKSEPRGRPSTIPGAFTGYLV
jgi:plasmid stability protein